MSMNEDPVRRVFCGEGVARVCKVFEGMQSLQEWETKRLGKEIKSP